MEVDVGDDLGGAGACVGELVRVGDEMEGKVMKGRGEGTVPLFWTML